MTKTSTYVNQQELKRLPIPKLEDTIHRFVERLAALQDDETREETRRICDDFLGNRNGDVDGDSDSDGDGAGFQLQRALIEYDRLGFEKGDLGSYVEEFWNESYLAPDDSVVMNLNPFFVLENSPDPKTNGDQLARAASLSFASIRFASALRQERIKPDIFKGKMLCMDQFRGMFGSTRHPVDEKKTNETTNRTTIASSCRDEIHVFKNSSHVVVMCCNQFFYFTALWEDTGDVAVNESDILEILTTIKNRASLVPQEKATREAVGVLSTLKRSEWRRARSDLVKANVRVNSSALEIIDSALFVLVLDDFEPTTNHSIAANMLHGSSCLVENFEQPKQQQQQSGASTASNNNRSDKNATTALLQVGSCLNRWYNKLQLIVCKDGTAGVNFEHSAIDGHTALRFVSDVFAETIIAFAESIVDAIHGRGMIKHIVEANIVRRRTHDDGNLLRPRKIVFDLPDHILRRIHYAEACLCDELNASDTRVLEFKDFGKTFIVGNNMSPDSFVQMSILLAYYKLYGKLVCTYEPVLTKAFYHGRTEGARSATVQAKELCEMWCHYYSSIGRNNSSNNGNDSTLEEKRKLLAALKRATVEHSRIVKEASQGYGVDRHLFSLKCISERNRLGQSLDQSSPVDLPPPPPPKFFTSEAWKTLNHTILSTSNCGNPSLRMFGFGPVVPDGYGVGYIIKDAGISFSVSSKHRQTQRYVHSLNQTLKEMEGLSSSLQQQQNQYAAAMTKVVATAVAPSPPSSSRGAMESKQPPTPKLDVVDNSCHPPQRGSFMKVYKARSAPDMIHLPRQSSLVIDNSSVEE